MKKILVIAFSGLLLSCGGNGYEINGEINGLSDGTRVFLERQDPEKGVVPVDTVKIEKGKFTFEGKADEPEIHSIRFDGTQGGFIVVVEKGDIKAVVNKDSIPNAKLTGTFNNDELHKYNAEMYKIQKRMMAFQQKNGPIMQQAQQKMDTVTMNRLSKEYAKFQQDFMDYNYKYVESTPKSFLSVLLIEGMFNEMDPKLDKIKKYFDALDADLKETKPGKRIQTKLQDSESVEVGKPAPDFSAKTPDGKTVSLKQSLGKATIIDFWASWCAPCRQENPNVVALYNEFHAKGLNIIGVSLDREGEADKWKEAIAKDQLTWTQVSNLKFWKDPIAVKYGIQSIPATFLLDASGKIVAKNLHGAELKAKVAELLAK
ncbi:TlpA disulfide reductase family protein [Flavobacterium humi]|uniref:AhpC/TSA family protein n=1 Tax=Flavobacterium humi TaxID=2562683 RepID=A0A4Z0L625_9FLAO|nr:TlpA disulfide reductase family protein [Flavobacterium humi]TGD56565.1 AhpC/TSA family protein [Flavobacterium humi]